MSITRFLSSVRKERVTEGKGKGKKGREGREETRVERTGERRTRIVVIACTHAVHIGGASREELQQDL